MAKTVVGLLAGALGMSAGSASADGSMAGKSIGEGEVRTISSGRYSELLRLACLNGLRYRPADIAHGFERSYRELRLALIDRGYAVMPETARSKLVVTEVRMDRRPKHGAVPEFGCFRAHWNGE